VRDIQKLSDQYRDMLAGYLRDFKSDMANIDENQRDTPEENRDVDMENDELNESIKKIKSQFKRFL
jgi:septal ring factor EnvC (AmiA/AmiB activator)